MHDRCVQRRTPVNGALELTWRCNLRCLHCSVNRPAGDRRAAGQELSADEYARLLDQLAEAGCLWLLFTGGEPLLRPDFPDIYLHAKKRGFLVTLFTNGTLVTDRVADLLAEWPPFSVEISLYGRTPAIYESVTRVPGSFAKCLKGIRLLRERGIPIELKSVVIRENKDEILQIQALAEEMGLRFRFDAMITPRLDCAPGPLQVRLTPEEVVQLDLDVPKRLREWHSFHERFCRRSGHIPPEDLYECGAGISTFSVDPAGGLGLCSLSTRESYDLRRGNFSEGWEALAEFRARKATRQTKCTNCSIKVMCGMCPANAELEVGDPEEPIDFLCRTSHLRAARLGMAVDPHGECEYCRWGAR